MAAQEIHECRAAPRVELGITTYLTVTRAPWRVPGIWFRSGRTLCLAAQGRRGYDEKRSQSRLTRHAHRYSPQSDWMSSRAGAVRRKPPRAMGLGSVGVRSTCLGTCCATWGATAEANSVTWLKKENNKEKGENESLLVRGLYPRSPATT